MSGQELEEFDKESRLMLVNHVPSNAILIREQAKTNLLLIELVKLAWQATPSE